MRMALIFIVRSDLQIPLAPPPITAILCGCCCGCCECAASCAAAVAVDDDDRDVSRDAVDREFEHGGRPIPIPVLVLETVVVVDRVGMKPEQCRHNVVVRGDSIINVSRSSRSWRRRCMTIGAAGRRLLEPPPPRVGRSIPDWYCCLRRCGCSLPTLVVLLIVMITIDINWP